jgi:hypothetical protein
VAKLTLGFSSLSPEVDRDGVEEDEIETAEERPLHGKTLSFMLGTI